MSIPSNWPMNGLSIFYLKESNKDKDDYRLDESRLSKDECHMFFPVQPCEELLIVTALEFMTFNPSNKKMNKKFNINPIKIGNLELMWCSFPKEFKEVCERAGQVFEMTMQIMSRKMISMTPGSKQCGVEFPRADNLLIFQGKRCSNPEKIAKECSAVVKAANSLDELGID